MLIPVALSSSGGPHTPAIYLKTHLGPSSRFLKNFLQKVLLNNRACAVRLIFREPSAPRLMGSYSFGDYSFEIFTYSRL